MVSHISLSNRRYSLGLHIGHDRGAALVRDGELIGYVAQERLDRKKHSMGCELPHLAIDALLEHFQLKMAQIRTVGISFDNSVVALFVDDIADDLKSHYRVPSLNVVGIRHHLAHALASWGTSGFGDSLVFVADGSGDLVENHYEAETLFQIRGGQIQEVEKRLQAQLPDTVNLPYLYNARFMPPEYKELAVSLGKKYEQFTHLLGFGWEQHGKTMALAAYGRSLIDIPAINPDGIAFKLNAIDLLNELETVRSRLGISSREFVRRCRADIARTVQDFTEHALVELLFSIKKKFGGDALCLGGGVFLNCVANGKLLSSKLFERIYVPPGCADDGQAIGAAFGAGLDCGFRPPRCSPNFPFLGLDYSQSDISTAISTYQLRSVSFSDQELTKYVARRLAAGAVVGMFRGRTEIGPRALCHRSILLDPRRSDGRDFLNERVKFRESFRPFAPVVTQEAQYKYFDLSTSSPYMLVACDVRPEYRLTLPAITHVDGTARVQTVNRSSEPFIYELLLQFEKLSGVPILLNTSFNVAGEPIVETPRDAIRSYLNTNIDLLVMENEIIEKAQQGAAMQ